MKVRLFLSWTWYIQVLICSVYHPESAIRLVKVTVEGRTVEIGRLGKYICQTMVLLCTQSWCYPHCLIVVLAEDWTEEDKEAHTEHIKTSSVSYVWMHMCFFLHVDKKILHIFHSLGAFTCWQAQSTHHETIHLKNNSGWCTYANKLKACFTNCLLFIHTCLSSHHSRLSCVFCDLFVKIGNVPLST